MSDDVYELYAIRYATNPRRRRVENLMWVAPDDPHDTPMPMDFFVWAAVSPSRTVVIDTGADERTCAGPRAPVPALPDGRPRPHRHRCRGRPAGGDDAPPLGSRRQPRLVPGRRSCTCSGRSWRTRRARAWPGPFLRRPYDPEQVATYLRRAYAGRVTFHDGAEEIAPGLSIHAAGGHTPGMQVVRVNTRRGQVVLTSDAVHYYENLDAENPFPVLVSTIDYVETLHRLRDLADGRDHLVPGHDPLVLASYPPARPELAGVVARLDVDPATTYGGGPGMKVRAAILWEQGHQPDERRPTRRGGGRPRRSRPRRAAGAHHGCRAVPLGLVGDHRRSAAHHARRHRPRGGRRGGGRRSGRRWAGRRGPGGDGLRRELWPVRVLCRRPAEPVSVVVVGSHSRDAPDREPASFDRRPVAAPLQRDLGVRRAGGRGARARWSGSIPTCRRRWPRSSAAR